MGAQPQPSKPIDSRCQSAMEPPQRHAWSPVDGRNVALSWRARMPVDGRNMALSWRRLHEAVRCDETGDALWRHRGIPPGQPAEGGR